MTTRASNHLDDYVDWVTPKFGDPTYSLLRAHLKFEHLLNQFLVKKLPHSDALKDARFTFSQKLVIAKAVANEISPSHWAWAAVKQLNKIRNLLAHDPQNEIDAAYKSYVDFLEKHSETPMPAVDVPAVRGEILARRHVFTAVDMATIGLYGWLSARLGLLTN